MRIEIAAKINADLFVFPPHDGYHPIDSIFVSVGLYDSITFEVKAENKQVLAIEFTGPYAQNIPASNNTVLKSVNAILNHSKNSKLKTQNLKLNLSIEKNIPSGAGLGGGSADAAGVLLGLNKILELNLSEPELLTLAAQIGSDVPFFIRGGSAHVTGRGEKIRWQNPLHGWIALIKPKNIHCATPDIYRQWDLLNNAKIKMRREASPEGQNATKGSPLRTKFQNPMTDARPSFFNDLYHPVHSFFPEYENWLWRLKRAGFGRSTLTGSGAAFFAWTETQAMAQKAQALFEPKNFDSWALPIVSQSCLWQT